MISLKREDVAKMPRVCAAKDCKEHFYNDLPKDWTAIIMYSGKRPDIMKWSIFDWAHGAYIDINVCPKHYKALLNLLKNGINTENNTIGIGAPL